MRGVAGSTPGHGTTARATVCRCEPCLSAKARYDKRRTLYCASLLDSTGSVRRLRALYVVGWSAVQLAAELGVTPEAVRARSRSNALIERETAERIDALYRRLHMTPGPSVRARKIAERRGWMPPLAWDEDTIDDPHALPDLGDTAPPDADLVLVARVVGGTPSATTAVDRDVIIPRLAATGMGDAEIAALCGVSDRTILRTRQRLGVPSLYAAMTYDRRRAS